MPNELPLPPELHHLIEKREDEDRRVEQRRGKNSTVGNVEDDGVGDATTYPEVIPAPERRVQEERRDRERRHSDR